MKSLKKRIHYVLCNDKADKFVDFIIIMAVILVLSVTLILLYRDVIGFGGTRNNATQGTGWFRTEDTSGISE